MKYHAMLALAVPGLLITGVLSLALTGCGDSGYAIAQEQRPTRRIEGDEIAKVQTVSVRQQDLEQTIELAGTVEGFETADLYAKVGGYLDEITVDIGDQVSRGQVLATLSIPEMVKELRQKEAAIAAAEAEVYQAEAAIGQAKAQIISAETAVEEFRSQLQERESQVAYRDAEFQRTKGLVERGSLNQELLDEITFRRDAALASLSAAQAKIRSMEAALAAKQADVEKANADRQTAIAHVELAKADRDRIETLLQYGYIKAPFDGVVTKRMADPGAFIQPAEGISAAKPLLTVTRTDVVRISVQLPMEQVRWLDRGDKAVLDRINVLPGEKFEGKVTRFSTVLNKESRLMHVAIDLANPDNRLMPGYYGYVTLHLEQLPRQAVIPASAMLTDDHGSYVLVVAEGKCRKCPVKCSYQDGSIVGVASGLVPGEQVVQSGGGSLADGQQVVAVNSETGT